MLSIMSLACQGADGDELARQKGDSPEERRKHIFSLYVEQMFQRKGINSVVFLKEKTIGWLSWLAGKMKEHSQSVFLVEGLQPSWLGTRAERAAYGTFVALSLGLLAGLIFGLGALSYGLSGLSAGLSFGLIILVGIALGCRSESPLKNGIMSGSIGGLIVVIFGLSAGLLVGLFGGLNRGGSAVIKHYALRLILWLNGYTPFNLIKFLDQSAKLILLKKVGGGYIFIHRMLLDYFAAIETASKMSASK
jgi:hypothetical protein